MCLSSKGRLDGGEISVDFLTKVDNLEACLCTLQEIINPKHSYLLNDKKS